MEQSSNGQERDRDTLQDIRVRRASPSAGNRDAFLQLRDKLCRELLATLDPALDITKKSQLRPYVHERLDSLLAEMNLVLNRSEKRQLMEAIVEELSGSHV